MHFAVPGTIIDLFPDINKELIKVEFLLQDIQKCFFDTCLGKVTIRV
jgi:hypothetical protein